ncbi:MAG TPA: twin-arginine translocase TatA/TatE family subunit [Anaeromyxobacter sp.]|nr:twin-arginine translocase TatA/TatE family subunit [Anaeromyxobacter sp.]
MELGLGEIVVVLLIVLILFGPSKLPKLGESLGQAIRNFKDGMTTERPAAGPQPPAELPAPSPPSTGQGSPAEQDPAASGAPPPAPRE